MPSSAARSAPITATRSARRTWPSSNQRPDAMWPRTASRNPLEAASTGTVSLEMLAGSRTGTVRTPPGLATSATAPEATTPLSRSSAPRRPTATPCRRPALLVAAARSHAHDDLRRGQFVEPLDDLVAGRARDAERWRPTTPARDRPSVVSAAAPAGRTLRRASRRTGRATAACCAAGCPVGVTIAVLRRSSITRSRAACRRRSARGAGRAAATSSSWVMTTIVRPSGDSSSNRSRIDDRVRRVEVAGRLVAQQEARLGGDGAGDGDALAFAARQPGRQEAGPVPQADSSEGGDRRRATLRAWTTPRYRLAEHHVLDRRAVRQAGGTTGTRTRSARSAGPHAERRSAPPCRCRRAGRCPAVGRSSSPTTFSSVDLPEPDGPAIAT